MGVWMERKVGVSSKLRGNGYLDVISTGLASLQKRKMIQSSICILHRVDVNLILFTRFD